MVSGFPSMYPAFVEAFAPASWISARVRSHSRTCPRLGHFGHRQCSQSVRADAKVTHSWEIMTILREPSMLSQEQAVEIPDLSRRGAGMREIAGQLGCSRNTVRSCLRDQNAGRYDTRAMVDQAGDTRIICLSELIRRDCVASRNSVAARDSRARYTGGISQLKAWLMLLKNGEPQAVVRFETPPGKQMQADFTWVRRGEILWWYRWQGWATAVPHSSSSVRRRM